MLRSASLEDIASYSCQAENVRMQTDLELRGADVKIEVGDEADGERSRDAEKGQEVTFTVPFGKELVKKPEAEWSFQGKRLEESDRVTITTSRTHATITIKQAENQDCGSYTLRLANAVSEVNVSFTLSIKGEISALLLLYVRYIQAYRVCKEREQTDPTSGCDVISLSPPVEPSRRIVFTWPFSSWKRPASERVVPSGSNEGLQRCRAGTLSAFSSFCVRRRVRWPEASMYTSLLLSFSSAFSSAAF